MGDSRDAVRKELSSLVEDGQEIHMAFMTEWALDHPDQIPDNYTIDKSKLNEGFSFRAEYPRWYSRALPVIEQLLPDRYDEFRALHQPTRTPANLTWGSYTVSDYLSAIQPQDYARKPLFDIVQAAANRFGQQVQILASALDRLDSLLANLTGVLEADLLDDELSAARELLKKKYLRAAGVVSGVVIEAHLKRVLATHGKVPRKAHPTISDLNDRLREAGVYDTPRWREIQRLGDIRNLAGHSNEREPTREEIQELIDGTDKIIKSVF